ncbi:MAG: virulence factor SrfB [Planctomycetaceae bacterium]|jgi:hypothetical protein|nr:virulence factor SrfB [Planctomycetaceae bacterium]
MSSIPTAIPYFHVIPKTGIQVYRSFVLDPSILPNGVTTEKLWTDAMAYSQSKTFTENPLIKLINDHIACKYASSEIESTGWMDCQSQFAFFRLNRNINNKESYSVDLVIDTNSDIGKLIKNTIPCIIKSSGMMNVFKKPYEIAGFYVLDPASSASKGGSKAGALILDFGNTGTTCLFAPEYTLSNANEPIQLQNYWDSEYQKRSKTEREIIHSNILLMQVNVVPGSPWIAIGERAKELIKDNALVTYLYSPKKYVRYAPPHLQAHAPAIGQRGIVGVRNGMFPILELIDLSLSQILQMVQGSIVNPQGTSDYPEEFPIVNRIMLTYPLTWRKVDRELFRDKVTQVAQKVLSSYPLVQGKFQVELVCSEPIAIVAYLLQDNFFLHGLKNSRMMRSTLGNLDGTDVLRILIIDIGGGSTDIAMVDVRWQYDDNDDIINATFQIIDTMRFNRAGDRITHFLVTAIWNFFKNKFGFEETLDLQIQSVENPSFDRQAKREVLSKITEIAEAAKPVIAKSANTKINKTPEWQLHDTDLIAVLDLLRKSGIKNLQTNTDPNEKLIITHEMLKEWIRHDLQSIKTQGEAGFMDIFVYVKELREYIETTNGMQPHQVIISGRTSKMPFIREFVIENLQIPSHRVRTLDEFWPEDLRRAYSDISKTAVVLGAQRFRFDPSVRFEYQDSEPIFNHYIGTVALTVDGFQLNEKKIFVQPGDPCPASFCIEVPAHGNVIIGNTFRKGGLVEVLATISNNSDKTEKVDLFLEDDFTITEKKKDNPNILFTENISGGNDFFADNFCDTGKIDDRPKGFITEIIKKFTPATQQQTTYRTSPKPPPPPPRRL